MKVKTLFVTIFFSVLFAIFLGLYVQDVARYFESHLFYIPPIITITVGTIVSTCLFILAIIIEFMILISGKIVSRMFSMIMKVILIVTIIIGLLVSWLSIFVMAMSWG
ncbi:hypothetical protein [Massilibacterium senegalense]|uniref:hypothetical protein n=1 Tax=Massilibacterium senegalense TaxID=1632858 RepID=UPI0007825EB1|nr:hypothetical protein [Massilibacterium senegalense]